MNKVPQEKTADGYYKMSGRLVEKEFIMKNGIGTGRTEYYFSASIQDYFIKLCESEVTREDLAPFLDRGITVTAKTMEGSWDQCPEDDEQMQSRIGWYIVIREII